MVYIVYLLRILSCQQNYLFYKSYAYLYYTKNILNILFLLLYSTFKNKQIKKRNNYIKMNNPQTHYNPAVNIVFIVLSTLSNILFLKK